MDAPDGAPEIAQTQDPRNVGRPRPHPPRVEGRDPRDVLERCAARAARIVCDFRRPGSGAAVFRQGHQQRDACRGRDDRRRHPGAVSALAVQQRRALSRAPERRLAGDGRRRVRHAGRCHARGAGTLARRPARARIGGAVLRRFGGPDAERSVSRLDDHDEPGGGRLHDARSASAARGAGRGARRADARRRAARAPETPRACGSGADRGRSTDRGNSRLRRRPLLQPVAVRPRDRVAAPAGVGVQAVRLPDRLRGGRGQRPQGRDARVDRHRRARDVRVRRSGLDAGELRADLRRPDHASPRARPLTQPGDDPRGAGGRVRSRGGALEEARRRQPAEGVSVDRARRVRGDAVRDRHGLHAVPQRRRAQAAQAHPAHHERRQGRHQTHGGRSTGRRAA